MRDIRWIRPGALVGHRDWPGWRGVVWRKLAAPYWWSVIWGDPALVALLGERAITVRDEHAARLTNRERA